MLKMSEQAFFPVANLARPSTRPGRTPLHVALVAATLLAPSAVLAQATTPAAGSASAPPIALPSVTVIAPSPLLGSGIDRDSVPAETHVLTSRDIDRDGTPDLTRALNQQLGGVTLDDAAGNPFQPTFFYHGFAASPLQGTPQGLAVYVNGMRFNQPFGDTVDWDLIPDIAIDRVDVLGSNPVFGLNALGGALNMRLKNGFGYHGLEADLSGGSFHQIQGEFQYGGESDDKSLYVAGNALHQDGWRDLQSSTIQNLYADLGRRDERSELHLSLTYAHSILNGPGTSPVELLEADRRAQFTAPNQISNSYFAAGLTGNFDVNQSASIQALAYYRHFHQDVVNGNAPNDTPCEDGSGFLCTEDGNYSTTTDGQPIPDFLQGGPYSELDTQSTTTNAYGASVQFTQTDDLFGRRNHFIAGFSFDGAHNDFQGASYIGGLTLEDRVFVGPGVIIDEPDSNSPVHVAITDSTYGIYFADTLNLTAEAALTLSGRYNATRVSLRDQNGGDLSGSHSYDHFNPAAGLTYKVAPWLTAYGGYAVANRAPTPSELSCAGPENSCSLANFFVGDPELQQVIAHTVEAGVRGPLHPTPDSLLTYDIAFFQSDLDNDIAFINSTTQGRAYFANIGQTQRRGVDVHIQLTTQRWLAYAAYSYIEAHFKTSFVEGSGDNPAADADGNITVQSGDSLPGIPAHQFKAGAYYKVSEQWSVGLTGVAASGAYLFGDEANLTPKLPGYYTLNFSTHYQLDKSTQLFAWVNNLTNQKYYTFGTFSPTSSVFLVQAPGATNPRSYGPAAPVSGFVGVRVTF